LDQNRRIATILLVDDEKPLRDLWIGVLSEDGYEMLGAANGKEALAVAERHPSKIDLLMTDVRMPGLSGPELAAKLLSSRPDLKVMFVSGDPTSAGDLPAGSVILAIPCSLKTLLDTVRKVLGR
jgi:CheY-like chemotaxis protein